MKTLVSLILALVGIGLIAWFVSFELNPYNLCEKHPKKRKTHLICKPFNIEMEKPKHEQNLIKEQFNKNRKEKR